MSQDQGPEKHCSGFKCNDSVISMNVPFHGSKEISVEGTKCCVELEGKLSKINVSVVNNLFSYKESVRHVKEVMNKISDQTKSNQPANKTKLNFFF